MYYDHHLEFLTDTIYQLIKRKLLFKYAQTYERDLLSAMHHT